MRVINATTVDVRVSRAEESHAARVVLYGDEVRVRGEGVPRPLLESVRRWARATATRGPLSEG